MNKVVYHVEKIAIIYRLYSYTVREETAKTYELNEGGYLSKDDPNVFIDADAALLRLTKLNDKLISDYDVLANTAYTDAEKLTGRMSAKEVSK